MRRVPLTLLVLSGLACGGPSPVDAGSDAGIDAGAGADAGPPSGPWRSALYPEGWTPEQTDTEGRFLHDFSYAGYHNGEATIGEHGPATIFDVADFGADPSGAVDSTAALQAAIDAASVSGGVVSLGAGLYRVDGTLRVQASRVVLRGEGPERTRLHFTTVAGRAYASHLTFAAAITSDLELPLASDALGRDRVVIVNDATGLAVGDDVDVGWVVTPQFVAEHSMTEFWEVFNDEWQPFFRRQVVAIDGPRVTLDVPLRYPARLRDAASLRRTVGWLREVGVESLGVADAGEPDDAWANAQTHAIELSGVADGWIRDVASYPSPGAPAEGEGAGAHLASGGVLIRASKRVTVADSHLGEAQNRGPGGNGYLFEVRTSSEILFRDCSGTAGRHNFITNWGFGTSGVVWLRVRSAGGRSMGSRDASIVPVGLCDYHHSLATANLVDSSVLDDGWTAVNRLSESSGAGHGATQSVFWNTSGRGIVRSMQAGHGYVIGTSADLDVVTWDFLLEQLDTEPEDWTEGLGHAELVPSSLYEDQLARRVDR